MIPEYEEEDEQKRQERKPSNSLTNHRIKAIWRRIPSCRVAASMTSAQPWQERLTSKGRSWLWYCSQLLRTKWRLGRAMIGNLSFRLVLVAPPSPCVPTGLLSPNLEHANHALLRNHAINLLGGKILRSDRGCQSIMKTGPYTRIRCLGAERTRALML